MGEPELVGSDKSLEQTAVASYLLSWASFYVDDTACNAPSACSTATGRTQTPEASVVVLEIQSVVQKLLPSATPSPTLGIVDHFIRFSFLPDISLLVSLFSGC